jgi:hypothetical protein
MYICTCPRGLCFACLRVPHTSAPAPPLTHKHSSGPTAEQPQPQAEPEAADHNHHVDDPALAPNDAQANAEEG